MSPRDLLSLAGLLSSTERCVFDGSGQLYFSAGSQIVCEQPLALTIFRVYVKLISLTNIVPLFHFSRSILRTFLCCRRSLNNCVEVSQELHNHHTDNVSKLL